MRTSQVAQPVTSIRNALATVAVLIGLWFLLSLAACARPPVQHSAATEPPTADRSTFGSRAQVTRFAPTGPIPLAQRLRPLRDWSRARA